MSARFRVVAVIAVTGFFAAVNSASAKVSVSEILCANPGQGTVDLEAGRRIEGLAKRAAAIGGVEGILVTTLITSKAFEPSAASMKRYESIKERLEGFGVASPNAMHRRYEASGPHSKDCNAGQVAVDVELLFKEPQYVTKER